MRVDGDRTFVIADLPGLIPGASEGRGLGHQFLRHTERTRLLLHVVDLDPASGRDPLDDLQTIDKELSAYSPALAERPQLVVANKADLVDGSPEAAAALDRLARHCATAGRPFYAISAATGLGLAELLRAAPPASKDGVGARRQLGRVRRLVVKVGTGLITTPSTGPDRRRIAALAADIAAARADGGRDVVLVTSGAIATGMARLALPERPRTMPEKQAAAAVGQSTLMRHYEVAFKRHGIGVGQVLLTAQDISDRARYLNARNTLRALLRFGVLPIVNENDTVAVEEIKVGDNDNLSALVASLIDADLLVLLTDVDGLYTANPAVNEAAHLLETVEAVTDEITAWRGRVPAAGRWAAWRPSCRPPRRRPPPACP